MAFYDLFSKRELWISMPLHHRRLLVDVKKSWLVLRLLTAPIESANQTRCILIFFAFCLFLPKMSEIASKLRKGTIWWHSLVKNTSLEFILKAQNYPKLPPCESVRICRLQPITVSYHVPRNLSSNLIFHTYLGGYACLESLIPLNPLSKVKANPIYSSHGMRQNPLIATAW